MIQICDALDKLYFQPYYTDVCLKTQVYGLFRNDLARKGLTDPHVESAMYTAMGIDGMWGGEDSEIAQKFPDDWHNRRVCAWLLFSQMLHHPAYTHATVVRFVRSMERLLRFYADQTPQRWMFVEKPDKTNANVICIIQRKKIDNVLESTEMFDGVASDVTKVLNRIVPCNISVELVKK